MLINYKGIQYELTRMKWHDLAELASTIRVAVRESQEQLKQPELFNRNSSWERNCRNFVFINSINLMYIEDEKKRRRRPFALMAAMASIGLFAMAFFFDSLMCAIAAVYLLNITAIVADNSKPNPVDEL